jgi:diguanylate cyclase (GGDEF)-like protein
VLRDALENLDDGVLLLDAGLRATFMNRKVRQFWELSDAEIAARPSYSALITRGRRAIDPNISAQELDNFAVARTAEVKAGNHVRELQTPDDRRLRAHCTNLQDGGRMITYYDITDLARNAEQLQILATTDSLTGLFNRRHFMEVLEAEWSRFTRYYRSLSVLMVDIDHFKTVNDRYGHAVGDEAIRAMASACLHGKRRSDVVGRVGGEEFAILLPETTRSQAKTVAERIRKHIASQIMRSGENTFHITASIGIAEAIPSLPNVESLIRAADQAMYEAKAQGRNRCVAFTPPEVIGGGIKLPQADGVVPVPARRARRVY